MKNETLARIVEHASNNSVVDLTKAEIEEMIRNTEARLGRELTGLVKEDKPFNQFYSKETLNAEYPKRKIASITMDYLEQNPDSVAIECGKVITRKEVYENVLLVADSLKRNGIKKGDIITICSPSTPELIYYFMAANLIGAITRPIDPIGSKETTRANLEATNSKLLITIDLNYKKFKGVTDGLDCKVLALSLNDTFPKKMDVKNTGLKALGKIASKFVEKDDNWTTHQSFISKSLNKKIKREDIEEPYQDGDIYSIYSSS
jgi:acyl-coenzyme A synthetase/AMP-(fatty) acid ligase